MLEEGIVSLGLLPTREGCSTIPGVNFLYSIGILVVHDISEKVEVVVDMGLWWLCRKIRHDK